jgi:drug/metabolite transporter (DMT)-like permease
VSQPDGHRATQWGLPAVFVLIWSTGFIVARYGMPHAPPMTFLAWRYALSLLVLMPWIGLAGVRWPDRPMQFVHLAVTGVLMHAGYLGGVWAAVKAGMGSGLSALIVGLQPVLTALWLSQRGSGEVSRRQGFGVLLGFGGLVLVVSGKLVHGVEANPVSMACVILALLSITVGTLYQKQYVLPCDARSANAVQLLAALAVTLPLAGLESESVRWNHVMLGAMLWSSLALTVGASSLLYLLIQRGAATGVTSLLYLVPPTTALMAWVLFDEPVTGAAVAGMALTAWGVSLAVRTEPVRL